MNEDGFVIHGYFASVIEGDKVVGCKFVRTDDPNSPIAVPVMFIESHSFDLKYRTP